MNEKQQWAEHPVYTSAQVWQPAVRLLVVQVYLEDGIEKHFVFPVLGIATSTRRTYSRAFDSRGVMPHPPGIHEGRLSEAGWSYDPDASGIRHEPLLLIDGLLMPVDEAQRHYLEGVVELVEAPWPVAEDEKRLASIVQRMHERRRRLEKRDQQRKAAGR
jgi:hypothetical protein